MFYRGAKSYCWCSRRPWRSAKRDRSDAVLRDDLCLGLLAIAR